MTTDDHPKPPEHLDREQLLEMYRKLLLIRGFETKAKRLFEGGELAGFLHLSAGQEAVPVGTAAALRPDDYVTSTHRGHGDVIAKGVGVDQAFAELYGRKAGICKGKGGSMHIADFSKGIIGATGIVSGALPTAPGLALSVKMRGTDQVVVAYFGDGATAEGGFHEALNLATVWQVPLIFVCQNNRYGLSLPYKDTAYKLDLVQRAESYHMPAVSVDGMDPLAVYEAAREAVQRARGGGGPSFVEARTYRFLGHYVGDAGAYIPEGELEEWKKRDPIPTMSYRLRLWGYLTSDEDEELASSVDAELEAAVEHARQSPTPAPEEALEDVYVNFDYEGRPLAPAAESRQPQPNFKE